MSTTPPGWYDDGQHPGQQRYWDGAQWTEQYQPAGGAPAAPAAPTTEYVPANGYTPSPSGGTGAKKSIWVWLAPVLAVIVLGGTGVGLWLGGVFGGSPFASDATPEVQATIQRFGTSVAQRDCVALFETATPAALAGIGSPYTSAEQCQQFNEANGSTPDPARNATVTYTVPVAVAGDTATATATFSTNEPGEQPTTLALTLQRTNGKWVIQTITIGGATSSPTTVPTVAPVVDDETLVQDAITSYENSLVDGDCATFQTVVSQNWIDEVLDRAGSDDICQVVEEYTGSQTPFITFGETSVQGSSATVIAEVDESSGLNTYEYELVKNGSSWVIDYVTPSSDGPAPEPETVDAFQAARNIGSALDTYHSQHSSYPSDLSALGVQYDYDGLMWSYSTDGTTSYSICYDPIDGSDDAYEETQSAASHSVGASCPA